MRALAAQRKSADSRQRQVDGAGRPVGLSRSVTVTRQNPPLVLQIETNGERPAETSRSVTSSRPNRVQMLQIEMNG